jgi:hypothetical protein
MAATDGMLDKIRKLLAMAEAEGLAPEARDTYNEKASQLIAQYGIDRALLEADQPDRRTPGDVILDMDPPYALDKLMILAAVAEPLGCRVIRKTSRRDGRSHLRAHLFGMASDLHRVDLLYTSLLVQTAHGLATATVPALEDPRAFRRSWLAGFAAAVAARLRTAEAAARRAAEQTRPATPSGRSVALVLADRRTLVEAHLATVYPRLRTGRTRRLSGSGGDAGYRAGQRADLGGPRVASTRPRRQLH